MDKKQNSQAVNRYIAPLGVVVTAGLSAGLAMVESRPNCEWRRGAEMLALAASEGQRPARRVLKSRAEMLDGFKAGLTIDEIAFCLDVPASVVWFNLTAGARTNSGLPASPSADDLPADDLPADDRPAAGPDPLLLPEPAPVRASPVMPSSASQSLRVPAFMRSPLHRF